MNVGSCGSLGGVLVVDDAAGSEAMLCGLQDELLAHVEERQPRGNPLQQLHGEERRRRPFGAARFFKSPPQQWRGEAGRPMPFSPPSRLKKAPALLSNRDIAAAAERVSVVVSLQSKQEIHRRSARLRSTKYKAPASEKKVSTKGKGRRHIFKLKNVSREDVTARCIW